jgi:hypothetical protein
MKETNADSSDPASNPTSPNSAIRSLGGGLRQFRFLAVVLGIAIALGFYEYQREDLSKDISRVDPNWLLNERVNLANTLVELYPSRSHGHFLKGYQAHMCWSTEPKFSLPVCWSFPYQDLRDVKDAFEKAIQLKGNHNEEELYRFYAGVLSDLHESPEKIDEAIRNWRKHYPHSLKPDPREQGTMP